MVDTLKSMLLSFVSTPLGNRPMDLFAGGLDAGVVSVKALDVDKFP
jgi:hypothetical protein